MGRKPAADDKKQETSPAAPETPEDPPVIKELKAVDDKVLSIEQELDKEIAKLRNQYKPRLDPLLAERRKVLDAGGDNAPRGDDANTATPACRGFWLTALKNLPSMQDVVEDHDEEVLEYLADIRANDIDPEDELKGFKVELEFSKNPFFTNDVITVEYTCKESNPYAKDMTCAEIQGTEIDWKPGKDVTVEKTSKKVKGGGAKKQKQKAKETIEPRPSFFRSFANLKVGDELPEWIAQMDEFEDEDEEGDELLEQYIDNQMEVFRMVKENLIPHAVRVYTGEAFPDDGDDDEESEEEDDDSDDEESDDSPADKKKGAAKKGGAKAPAGKEKEECKQQ